MTTTLRKAVRASTKNYIPTTGQVFDEDLFIAGMNARWKSFGNWTDKSGQASPKFMKAWRSILACFEAQVSGEDGLHVSSAPCGSAKTTAVEVACAQLAKEQPNIGALIIVRLIDQADEIASNINAIVGRDVALAFHSKSFKTNDLNFFEKYKNNDIREKQILVITHAQYLSTLASESKDSKAEEKKQRVSFWINKTGEVCERKFRVCDESLNLIERPTFNVEDVADVSSLTNYAKAVLFKDDTIFRQEKEFISSLFDFLVACSNPGKTKEEKMGEYLTFFKEQAEKYGEFFNVSTLETFFRVAEPKDFWGDKKFLNQQKIDSCADTLAEINVAIQQVVFMNNDGNGARISTGTMVLPEKFQSLCILDATSNVDAVYDILEKQGTVHRYDVDRDVRDFSNATLHIYPEKTGLGKSLSKTEWRNRLPKVLTYAKNNFDKDENILFCAHKEQALLLKKEFKKLGYDNWDVIWYGIVDGRNCYRSNTKLVVLSLPYLPNYFNPSTAIATSMDKEDPTIASINHKTMSVKVIQLICRIIIRMVEDKHGNCPLGDIYLPLPAFNDAMSELEAGDFNRMTQLRSEGKSILTDIVESLHRIKVVNWDKWKGYERISVDKKGAPKQKNSARFVSEAVVKTLRSLDEDKWYSVKDEVHTNQPKSIFLRDHL